MNNKIVQPQEIQMLNKYLEENHDITQIKHIGFLNYIKENIKIKKKLI